jgi:hypothetical protein
VSEAESEQLDRESLLRATSEREHLEVLANSDDGMAMIAEKLLEIDEEDQ